MLRRTLQISTLVLVFLIATFIWQATSPKTELARVLRTWNRSGGNLMEMLWDIDHPSIATEEEARTLVQATRTLQSEPNRFGHGFGSPLLALLALYEKPESEAAKQVLADQGLPEVRWWVQHFLDGHPVAPEDVMLATKILAIYQHENDVQLIANVALQRLEPGSIIWKEIFEAFEAHPGAGDLIERLNATPPAGYAGLWFLQLCNQQVLSGAVKSHPFDSDAGVDRLTRCLVNVAPSQFHFPYIASDSLCFLQHPDRKKLIKLALQHPCSLVQTKGYRTLFLSEASEAEKSRCVDRLIELCLDPVSSLQAQLCLKELGHEAKIPAECVKPEFEALTQMSDWLIRKGEQLRPADHLEIHDSRQLVWPTRNDATPIRVHLVKYYYRTADRRKPAASGNEPNLEMGVGIVGPMTFSLGPLAAERQTPEEILGLYCAWDMIRNQSPGAPERRTSKSGMEVLSKSNPGFDSQD